MLWSSAIASLSWGMEALIFGNLIMLASSFCVSSPSMARASGLRCSGLSTSENCEIMRAANEMSGLLTLMPYGSMKRFNTGSRA